MKKTYKKFKETEMTKMFDQLNVFFYGCGMKDFWVSEMNLPKKFIKIYDKVLILGTVMIVSTVFSNYASIFTQSNLSPQQLTDLILLCITTPVILTHYGTFMHYKAEVREILYHLVVVLKEHYYEKETVLQLIIRMKVYLGAYMFGWVFTMLERVVSSLLNVLLHGDVFNPFIVAWPDVDDRSSAGVVVQLVYFMANWFYGFRANGTYGMILILLLTMTYQFKDLQNYFYSLDLIFQDNNLSQEEKERKYEEGFKTGIYLHVLSLWCVQRCQYVCRVIFSSQLLLTIMTLIMLLRPLLVSEGLSEKLTQIPLFCAMLVVLALIMWNSGNITFEATCVSNAMYASGWQNCYGMSSKRIRKLVVNAMLNAQQPVVLKGFGIVDLSYENWIAIVKSSYSVFSVFY